MPVTGLLLLASLSSPLFLDQTTALGLPPVEGNACWADLNNDGWTDLCAGGVVWWNQKGKKFERGPEVGPVAAADFDNDGFVDLFSWSPMKLWRNVGGKSFAEVEIPKLPPTISLGACWGDFDGDRFADLYVGGFEDWNTQTTYPSFILTNRNGKSMEMTWTETRYRTRGVTACDFDGDGDLDVYTSNYRLQPNQLWVNKGRGIFVDQAEPRNAIATSDGFGGGHSIGAAWGDFDADGEIDLFAGNFAHVDNRGDQPKSRFLRNRGHSASYRFEDKGPSGIPYQESYASPAAGDYDNDGDLDLFFTTVYADASFGKKNYPMLFRNEASFLFADVSLDTGVSGLGPTYQAAWADFDNDGDLDLATNGKVFVNQTSGSRWLKVSLVGSRSVIGAQVRLRIGNKVLTRHVEAGTGQGNQNDMVLHFGLGKAKGPFDLEILWPGGRKQTVRRVSGNRLHRVEYSGS